MRYAVSSSASLSDTGTVYGLEPLVTVKVSSFRSKSISVHFIQQMLPALAPVSSAVIHHIFWRR